LGCVVWVASTGSNALKTSTACRSKLLAASGQFRAFVGAVSANACPEVAISVTIDAAKARFFVMAGFPYAVRILDCRNAAFILVSRLVDAKTIWERSISFAINISLMHE
jgi:hypothetical protein